MASLAQEEEVAPGLALPERLARARAFMDERYDQPLDLDQISRQANFSRYHFIRLFRRAFRQTPHQYLTRTRLEKAKGLLASTELTITEVCLAVGFHSLSSFSGLFRRAVGVSPRRIRAEASARRRAALRHIPACLLITAGPRPRLGRNGAIFEKTSVLERLILRGAKEQPR